MPTEDPSCQVWLLGPAASFVSPYAAADLGKTALKRKGDRSFREDDTGCACPVSHLVYSGNAGCGSGRSERISPPFSICISNDFTFLNLFLI